MTLQERNAAVVRFTEFSREHPGFLEHLPAVMLGVGNKEICSLDATYADLRHYERFLQRRIQRRGRLKRA